MPGVAATVLGTASGSEWTAFIRSAAGRSYERERVDVTVRRTDPIPLAHARSYEEISKRDRPARTSTSELRHFVHLHESDASRVADAADLRGVAAGLQRDEENRIVAGSGEIERGDGTKCIREDRKSVV